MSTGEGEGQEIPPWVLTPPEGGARGSHRREGQDALSNLSSHSGLPSRFPLQALRLEPQHGGGEASSASGKESGVLTVSELAP